MNPGPSPEARFSVCRGYAQLAAEDAAARERLARQCGIPDPDGSRYNPQPRVRTPNSSRFGLDGWPVDVPPLASWTDLRTCALCRLPLSKGANGQGRPNKTSVCSKCHDSVTFLRRSAILALVAARRGEIEP